MLLLRAGANVVNSGPSAVIDASAPFVHDSTTAACAHLNRRWQTKSGTAAKVWLGGQLLDNVNAIAGTVQEPLPVAAVKGVVVKPRVYFGGADASVPVEVILVGYTKDGGKPTAGKSEVELKIEAPDMLSDVQSVTQIVTLDKTNDWRSSAEISLMPEWFDGSSLIDATVTAQLIARATTTTAPSVVGTTTLHPRSAPAASLLPQRLEAALPYQPLYAGEDVVLDVYAHTDKPLQTFSATVKIEGDGVGIHFGASELSAFNAPQIPLEMYWQSTVQLPNGRKGSTASMFSRRDLSNQGCVDLQTRSWCPDRTLCECGAELLFRVHLRIPANAAVGAYDVLVSLSSDMNVDGETAISSSKVSNVGVAAVLEGRVNDASGNVALHVASPEMVGIFSRLPGTARMVNTAVINGVEVKQPLDIYGVMNNGVVRKLKITDRIDCTLSQSAVGVLQPPSLDCANVVLDENGVRGGKGVEVRIALQGSNLATTQRVSVWHPLLDTTFDFEFLDTSNSSTGLAKTAVLNKIAGWTDRGEDGTCASPRQMYQHVGFRTVVDFRTSADDTGVDSTFTEDITGLITDFEAVDNSGIVNISFMNGQPTNVNVRMVHGLRPGTTTIRAVGPSGSNLCTNCTSDTVTVTSLAVSATRLHAVALKTEDVEVTSNAGSTVCVSVPQTPPVLEFEGVEAQIVTVVQFDDGTLMELLPEHGLELVSVKSSSIATKDGSRIVQVPAFAQNASGGIVQAFWNPPCSPEDPLVRSCAVLKVEIPSAVGVNAVPKANRLTRRYDSAEDAGIPTRTEVDVSLIFDMSNAANSQWSQNMNGDNRTIITLTTTAGEQRLNVERTLGENGKIYLNAIDDAPIGKTKVTVSFTHSFLTATFDVFLVEYTRFHVSATPEPMCSGWETSGVDPTELSLINGTSPETFQQAKLTCVMEISDGDRLALGGKSQITLVGTSAQSAANLNATPPLLLDSNNVVIATAFGSAAAHCKFSRNETLVPQALPIFARGTVRAQEITSLKVWQKATPLTIGISNAFRGKAGVDTAVSCIQVRMTDGHCYGESGQLCSPFTLGSELPGLPRFEIDSDAADVDASTGVITLQGNSITPAVAKVTANGGTNDELNFTSAFNANLDPVDAGDVDVGQKDGVAIKPLVVGEALEVEVRVNTNGQILETFDIYIDYVGGNIVDLLNGTVEIDTANAAVRTTTSCKSVLVTIYRQSLRINGKCTQSNNVRNDPNDRSQERWATPGIAIVAVKLKAIRVGVPSITGYLKALTNANTKVTIGPAIVQERWFVAGDFSHGKGRRAVALSSTAGLRKHAGDIDGGLGVRHRRSTFTPLSVPGDADFGSYPALVDGESGRGRCNNNDLTFFDEWFNMRQTCTDGGIIAADSPSERSALLFKYKCCYEIVYSGQRAYSGSVCTNDISQAGMLLLAEDVNGTMCMSREMARNDSGSGSGTSCCFSDSTVAIARGVEQDGTGCPSTAQDGFNIVRSDAYVEVSKMTENTVYADYWGGGKPSNTLWEHFMDLDFDGLITSKDILYLHWSLVGLRVLVQEPPDLSDAAQIRSAPVVISGPTSLTGCQLQARTSLFLVAGTDIFDMALAGEQLDDVVRLFLVLATPSSNFTLAMNESIAANTSTSIHLTEGVGVLVNMVQQYDGSNATVVADASGKVSGVYVEFTAALDSSIDNTTALDAKVSLAVAVRQKAVNNDLNPEATVVYMPMKADHARPLVTGEHLEGWGSHSYAFCETRDESCIYDELTGTAGFDFPIGMGSTASCLPQAARVPLHQHLWWIMILIFVLTLLLAAVAYLSRRKPLETAIVDISPALGLSGDEVTITGQNMCLGNPKKNTPLIRLAGVAVKQIVGDPTDVEIIVIAGDATEGTSGTAVLTYPSGSKKSTEDPKYAESPEDVTFTYEHEFDRTTIVSITPSNGVPGDEIEIEGTRLHVCGGKYYEQFTLAGIPVTRIVGVPTKTKVKVIAGEADPGTSGRVALEATNGFEVLSDTNTIFSYTQVFNQTVVTSITPNEGVGGDMVTIEGKFLCGGYKRGVNGVLLAGIPVRKIVGKATDTKIVVFAGEAPPSTSGTVTLKSKWDDVFETPEDMTFSYCKPFHDTDITHISPTTGEAGTEVAIFGSNLLGREPEGVGSVTLAGIPVMRIVGTPRDDQIIVIAGHASSGTSGKVMLTGGSGARFSSSPNVMFTYDEEDESIFDFSGPVIDDVNPRFGAPGTKVVITGSKLPTDGEVSLAGVHAKPVGGGSSSQIVVIAGEALPGTHGIVRLQTSSGSLLVQTTSIKFSYFEAFRETVITRIQPTQGFSGTEVTIYGSKLHGGDPNGVSNVLLAGISTQRIVGRPTDSKITVIAGDAAPKTKGVVALQTAAGSSFKSDSKITFQYWPEFYDFSISSVKPMNGKPGTEVLIVGENLNTTPLKTVFLGSIEAKVVGTPSNTRLTVVAGDAPPGTSGSISFKAESGATHNEPNWIWSYQLPDFHGFTISSVKPTKGAAGTKVTITGENLNVTPLKSIFLAGGNEAKIIGKPSSTSITVVAGDAISDTSGAISFEANSGTTRQEPDWVWSYFPDFYGFEITKVLPTKGTPGTKVTIMGANLNVTPLKSVFLAGGNEAQIVGKPSHNSMTVIAGDAAPGASGSISFVARSGTSRQEPNFIWDYRKTPQIVSFDPSQGLAMTDIEVTGEEMLMGGDDIVSVTIAGVPATFKPGTATNERLTIRAGLAKIDQKTKMGPKGPIVVTGIGKRQITSDGIYTYNAKDFSEGQRMKLQNGLFASGSGTFSLGKALRRTAASVDDAVDLSTGVPISNEGVDVAKRIEYGSYNYRGEKKPSVLLRSDKIDSSMAPSMLQVRSQQEAAEVKGRWVVGMGVHRDELESFVDDRGSAEDMLANVAAKFASDAAMTLAHKVPRKKHSAKKQKQKDKKKKAKASGAVVSRLNTARRNQSNPKQDQVDQNLARTVLRTMEFPPDSEFVSCIEGEVVMLVPGGEEPDGYIIQREDGNCLIHRDAFIRDLSGLRRVTGNPRFITANGGSGLGESSL